jgi:adenylylsulfate kinase
MNKVIWMTGLPSAGKTTLAKELNKHLDGIILDGDEIRNSYISKGLGFSKKSRDTNLFRVAEIAKICLQKSHVICSFVSPYESTRQQIKEIIGEENFIEVYVKCDLDVCIDRDVKGLYQKALDGLIDNFTGISDPYEEPSNPSITVNTKTTSISECVEAILKKFENYKSVYALYIGRWNGVYHNGHAHIIQEALNQGKNVLMAIRDIKPDENNPWSAKQTKEMLDYYYKDEPRVKIIIIPDIDSVNYGRGVGYEINEIKVTKEIAGISGTKCRELLAQNDLTELQKFVPSKIIEFLQKTT